MNRRQLIKRLVVENADLVRSRYPITAVLLLILTATTATLAIMLARLMSLAFGTEATQPGFQVVGIVAALFVVRGGIEYANALVISRVGNEVIARFQGRLFRALHSHAPGETLESASTSARLMVGARSGRTVLESLFNGLLKDVLLLSGLIGVMVWHQPGLALLSVPGLALVIPLLILVQGRTRAATQTEFTALSNLVENAQDVAAGWRTIRALGARGFMIERSDRAIAMARDQANRIVATVSSTGPITEIISALVLLSVFLVAARSGAFTAENRPDFIAFLTAMILAFQPLKRLSRLNISIANGLVHLENMYQVLDREGPEQDRKTALPVRIEAGRISLRDVTFGYDPGTPVLRGLSLEVKPGEVTGLIGASGGGKTTTLSLIEGFFTQQAGRIEIDGYPATGPDRPDFGDQIALVSQETFLLHGTLAENIACGEVGDRMEAIRAAAREAGADAFISALPDGYETFVGGENLTLSMGQRQRIGIARALFRDPPILLLDEATAGLDPHTEAQVTTAILRIMKQRTTLVVTHNMALAARADTLYLLENGTVRDHGPSAEVLARIGPDLPR